MKSLRPSIFISFILFLAISCGSVSDEDRVAHKWKVKSAYSNYPDPTEITDEYRAMIDSINKGLNEEFASRIYDIKKDGSFSLTNKGATISGKWELTDNRVNFKVDNLLYEQWSFPDNKINIYANSSLTPLTGENGYIQLELFPAEGETVTPDTF